MALASLVVLASYLLGAVPFGLVMARVLKGVDLREVGSGNIGATNAMRVLGKPLGIVAFLLDFAKGLVPTLLLASYAPALDDISTGLAASLCGIAAVLGHCFPVYLGFKGGKGVATGCGAISGVQPLVFVVAGVVWLVTLFTSRFVSLASIAMGVTFPVAAAVFEPDKPAFIAACALLTLLVLARHRSNLVRLRAGTEPRIGRKPVPTGLDGAQESIESS
ncbi:MAG: glycerol-3-phosphate 1-O-acyltransferase PlsY [Planctomycetota bacterium]